MVANKINRIAYVYIRVYMGPIHVSANEHTLYDAASFSVTYLIFCLTKILTHLNGLLTKYKHAQK